MPFTRSFFYSLFSDGHWASFLACHLYIHGDYLIKIILKFCYAVRLLIELTEMKFDQYFVCSSAIKKNRLAVL